MFRWFAPLLSLAAILPFADQCVARPTITVETVLQICGALSDKAISKMPALVTAEAAKEFVEKYSRYSEIAKDCVSAEFRQRGPDTENFVVQNTRHQSEWRLSIDDNSITEITIQRYRAITVADDEDWRDAQNPERILPNVIGAAPSKRDPNVVSFFYATNREEAPSSATLVEQSKPASGDSSTSVGKWTDVGGYTGERSVDLSYGAVQVRVPESHGMGRIELPFELAIFGVTLWRQDSFAGYHFTLESVRKTGEPNWIKALASLKSEKGPTKRALIFIPGFNTKFDYAAFRTAQLIWDLRYKGAVVLFSWPSRGHILDYEYDHVSAHNSRQALLHVIGDLRLAGFNEIHILAHSMGSEVAIDALADSALTTNPTKIAQLIMAAPDVDSTSFRNDFPQFARVVSSMTLYASSKDKALTLSKRVAGAISRAGDVPTSGPIVLTGLTTIDASAVGTEIFGLDHSYFSTSRNILNHLGLLLVNKGMPPSILSEIAPVPPSGGAYYKYLP